MSAYRGIYVLKDPAGNITDVQVVSQPDGNSLPLPIETYRARNVHPAAESLPDQKEWPAVANRCQQIHQLAIKSLYPAQAANFARPVDHPHSAIDRENIASSVRQIVALGGEVHPVAIAPGGPSLGTRLVVIDASGLEVPDNVRIA